MGMATHRRGCCMTGAAEDKEQGKEGRRGGQLSSARARAARSCNPGRASERGARAAGRSLLALAELPSQR
jgi:hypothetical protein